MNIENNMVGMFIASIVSREEDGLAPKISLPLQYSLLFPIKYIFNFVYCENWIINNL